MIKQHDRLHNLRSDVIHSKEKVLSYVTGIVITSVIIFFNYVEARICVADSYATLPLLNSFEFYVCTILGIMFFFVGVLMIFTTRKYCPKFFEEFGVGLSISTFILTISMILKGLNLYLFDNNRPYQNLYQTNYSLAFTISVLTSTVLPILAQIAILLFGMRKIEHKEKESQK